MTAAVIIARGGSKRLPRKNVRPFCGLPLLAWSIIQAKSAREVDWVFLVTDDDEIESIGREYGAEVFRHPDWGAASGGNRAFMWGNAGMEAMGIDVDILVQMLPTSPLRLPEDLDRGIEAYRERQFHVKPLYRRRETFLWRDQYGICARWHLRDKSSAFLESNSGMFTVTCPQWHKWYSDKLGEAIGNDDQSIEPAAQDPDMFPDGQTYYVECEQWQCTEVDTIKEFELAEVLMEHYILRGRGRAVYDEYARGESDERLEKAE